MKSSSVLLLCITLAIATIAQAIPNKVTTVSIQVQKKEGTFNSEEFETAVNNAYGDPLVDVTYLSTQKKRATSEEGILSFTGEDASKTYLQASKFVTQKTLTDYFFDSAAFASYATPSANECPSSYDKACSEATNGVCYDAGKTGSGFCSCLSGYSGPQCDTTVTGHIPAAIAAGAFSPIFDWKPVDEEFVFTVEIPSTEATTDVSSVGATIIALGVGPNTCGYPISTKWAITAETKTIGYDVYTATFSFDELRSCGLAELSLDSEDYTSTQRSNFIIYRGPITIERDFKIDARFGTNSFPLTRKSSLTINYDFQFPKELNINTVALHTIDNSGSMFSSLTDSSYNIEANKWTFIFTAVTQFPYQLAIDGTPVLSGDSAGKVRSRGLSTTCDSTASDSVCVQTLKLEVGGCKAVSFEDIVDFKFVCIKGKDCSTVSNPVKDSVTFTVLTSGACPVQHKAQITDTTLAVYSDLALTDARKQFGASEDIYFAAAFNSMGPTISSVVLESLCFTLKGEKECTAVDIESVDMDVLTNSPPTITPKGGKALALQNLFHVVASTFGKQGDFTVSATYTIGFGIGRQRSESKTFNLNSLKASINIVGEAAEKQVAVLGAATPASKVAHVPSTSSQKLASLLAVTLVIVALLF